MDYRFGLIAIFVVLDASFIWTIDGRDSGTNTRIGSPNQSRAHLAKQFTPTYNPFLTPDFVFPTAFEIAVAGAKPILSQIQKESDPSKTKSELKCDKYAREVVDKTGITCLAGTSDANKPQDDTFHIVVVGGEEAKVDEFPHMVALGKHNSNKPFTLICGATLISHTWVLSAAHCTHGPNGVPSHARIGFHRLTDENAGVTVDIKQMIRHPDYKPPVMYADIALVKLRRAITFTASIRPACLHQQYDVMPINASISGWGVTEFAGDQSDRLQKADLDLIDNLACTKVHNNSKEVPYGIRSNMICAGDRIGGWTRDTCQGDSGGPLQVTHSRNTCLFQVIGITSFGQGCAMMDTPGVYTKVSYYVPWIESIVWPRGK
ncbi:trypsin-1-like isoform X2 [Linepithema humile]|uniref:trypsin-1-like isoform X2 n=1 Tax=Linepithema humile TaxID=83485 RepID=UPI0006234371|nr:PREDICTED: serine protease snake-like isoform X2 [Linepithema humile]